MITPQRSSSLLNLNFAKFASNIKRKMSDQHIVLQTPKENRKYSNLVSSSSNSSSVSSCIGSVRTRTKSGVLYIYFKTRRSFQLKWCTLDHGHLKYFNDRQNVAMPKESIPLVSIVSLRKHQGVAYDSNRVEIYTFTISYLGSDNKKRIEMTFGAPSPTERDKWMDIIGERFLQFAFFVTHNSHLEFFFHFSAKLRLQINWNECCQHFDLGSTQNWYLSFFQSFL